MSKPSSTPVADKPAVVEAVAAKLEVPVDIAADLVATDPAGAAELLASEAEILADPNSTYNQSRVEAEGPAPVPTLVEETPAPDAVGQAVDEVITPEPEPIVIEYREGLELSLSILRAVAAGENMPVMRKGELEALITTLEAARPPAPVHEETCAKVIFETMRGNMEAKGISAELAEALIPGSMPRECNCKVSRKRTTTTSTGTRATPVRLVAAGQAAVHYKDAEGKVHDLSCAQAAAKAAAEYPGAERCAAYVKQKADGKSLNARVFLRADVEAKRIPEGIVSFVGDPAAE